jgi:uncharacterized protein (TIGR02147 family)
LRGFAKLLGLSPATLSGVLNHKRSLSLNAAMTIANKLDWDPKKSEHFFQQVAKELGGQKSDPKKTGILLHYSEVSLDDFSAISDWYHFAILEITFISDFKSEPKWIAKRLGISVHEAADAIDRLKRLELLIESDGKLIKSEKNLATPTDHVSRAIRKRHKQILDRAKEALDQIEISKRDFTSITIAIDPAKLELAKEKIKKFRRELCSFLEKGNPKEVYELSVQLFPLTNPRSKS